MKKRFKGFTLIECLVALGILGIASLTMAQIYAAVSQRNKMNHLVNTSLSNQMAYVEKYTNSEAIEIKYNNGTAVSNAEKTKPPHNRSGVTSYNNYVKVARTEGTNTYVYSYPVNIYVLRSRDRDNNAIDKTRTQVNSGDVGSTAGYGESDYNLRYKYFKANT